MVKINIWKDILKILIGFLVANALFNFYFSVSGNFPPPFPGGPQLTLEMSRIAIFVGLIVVAVLVYLVFLRKGTGKMNLKDVSKMLVGAFSHWFVGSLCYPAYLSIGISLILVCIFIYIGFLENNRKLICQSLRFG